MDVSKNHLSCNGKKTTDVFESNIWIYLKKIQTSCTQLINQIDSTIQIFLASLPPQYAVYYIVFKLIPLAAYGWTADFFKEKFPKLFKSFRDISGQVILISGAGNGIGRALAIEFSKQSVHLVLLDLNLESLEATSKLIDSNSKCNIYKCDVSDRHDVYRTAKIIREEVGKVDILVNNAGVVSGDYILNLDDEKIVKTMEVNTLSHFWMCKAFLPDMIETNKGHIVSIASMAGLSGFPRLTDYCASKHGAVGLMESLTLELQMRNLDGVRLTTVCPTLVNTGLFEGMTPPLHVNLTPEYVAEKTVEAVREDKELLMLPPWLYIVILLKWTVPERATRAFHAKSGLLTFMDTFTGRTPNNQPKNDKSE